MATKYPTMSSFETAHTIMVNGVSYDTKEYKKMCAAKKKAANNGKKKTTRKANAIVSEIRILPSDIKILMRGAKVMESLSAYYNHGYRQWGTVCKDILSLPEISSLFTRYIVASKAANDVISEINDIAKHNSKSVFAYVRKLSWKLEDVAKAIENLQKGVEKSGILNIDTDNTGLKKRLGLKNIMKLTKNGEYACMAQHECISGTGRRLGLKTLMERTDTAVKQLNLIVYNLQYIADNRTSYISVKGF